MKITLEEQNDVILLSVSGELDADTCPVFQKEIEPLMERKAAKVEMDLSKLTYISSKALRVMMSLMQRLMDSGGSLTVTKVSPSVLDILDMTGLSRSFLKD